MSIPKRNVADKFEATEAAAYTQRRLLGELASARESRGLTQAQLAEVAQVSRMTVQRAEAARSPDASSSLDVSTFTQLALALDLVPTLTPLADFDTPHPRDLVHRGRHFNRTERDKAWRDCQREKAFAQGWAAANEASDVGLSPVLPHLLPNVTQEKATEAATLIQWLGSDVGFDFLTRALSNAGYEIVDKGPIDTKRIRKAPF